MRSRDPIDGAITYRMPVLVKARPEEAGGRRILEVEASCEAVDYDGDVILQEALMSSAEAFVATGHLDLDHMSEFGHRLGIPDPASYIIGRPLEVKALPDRRTWVLCEIAKARDGQIDPARNRYDEFWLSLQREPPVIWYSSVYGYPVDLEDCASGACRSSGATRYVIKSMDWRSLAFTRTPKNEALTGAARIITAKSKLVELAKSLRADGFNAPLPPPNSMADLWTDAAEPCPNCGVHKAPSLLGYRYHLEKCAGYTPGMADIGAHAMMHRHAMRAVLAG